ncbi:MAG: hypothetical protein L0Z62_23100 [Gemmataceae bacterium]|nr:hypothetical protein [Gemmataceae bacterium]
MKHRVVVGSLAALTLVIAGVVADENLNSGPQTGKTIPGPFHPLNLTGAQAGKRNCLV